MEVVLLSENAKLPTRADAGAAGYDLYSAVNGVIPAHQRKLVSTDIVVALPYGTYGRVAPRSGLALNHGLDIGAEVISNNNHSAIGIVVFNHSDKDYNINIGDRIAQLILEVVITPEITKVEKLK